MGSQTPNQREQKIILNSPTYTLHPITTIPTQIIQGKDPWFAVNSFLHDWWCYAIDRHQNLIAIPPQAHIEEACRWAAFCAATVEELCDRTSYPCPSWVQQQQYVLEQPWFFSDLPSQRQWLLTTSPEPFRRRNIFVGANILDNKYEFTSTTTKPKWAVWSGHNLHELFGIASEKQ